MKKIIYFSLISLFSFFLFSQAVLAATCPNATTNCKLEMQPPAPPGQCPTGWESNSGTCAGTGFVCCKLKSNNTGNSNNSGFGFDRVAGVANDAGYEPGTELTIEQRISSIIAIFLSLLGVIFFILMIYGGYNWMTAAGDEKKVEKAKDTIRNALIGLVIVIAAYAISVLVITRLWGAGTTTL